MDKSLRSFGTEEFPIRASSIPLLMSCPWRAAMLHLDLFADTSGVAADTGSAVHLAIAEYHSGASYDKAMEVARASGDKFPRADWDEVRLHFTPYTADPRNQTAVILAQETSIPKIKIEIGGIIWYLQGTFDQIRLDSGRKILYDIKTGSREDAYNTLMNYTLQLAAYWVGAESIGYAVDAVGLIYTYGYRKRNAELPSPNGVFLQHSITRLDCETLMTGVARQVQSVRQGNMGVNPGSWCSICPAKNVSVCMPTLREKV